MSWPKIVKRSTDDNFGKQLLKQSTVIPQTVPLTIKDEDKTTVLLRDQLDYSPIINAVDKNTGKANFILPLIGLPNFSKDEKINFYYSGSSKDSNILGVGWSFPMNTILMEHQGSILPENQKYFLFHENLPQSLIFDSDNSTDSVYNFKLSDKGSNTQIRYFKKEERWEIDFMGTKQIYGRRDGHNDDPISYDLAWKYWRSPGGSPTGQVELPSAWFLSELRSGDKSVLYYSYDINNVYVPESGKKFTREVYLKTISDDLGNKIIFKYMDKESDEYNVPPLKSASGIYNTMKVQTRYLASYSLTTYNYHQYIKFIYNVENGIRLLTKIEQLHDPTNQPVLEFSYKKILNSQELERVILPSGTSVEFSYDVIGESLNLIEKVDLKCDVKNSYRVDYGKDFVLISYLNNFNDVVLKIFNTELTKEMYSSLPESESQRFPFLGENSVYYYEVKILEESIAITLDYGITKDVALINRENDKWSLNPKYFNYEKETILQFGNDFVAALDTSLSVLDLIIWDNNAKIWYKKRMEESLFQNSSHSLLKVSGKVFFLYDDKVVTVGYRDKNNEWQTKAIINLPGVISTIKDTLSKFDVDDHVSQLLMYNIKSTALQVSNNLVLLSRWNIENTNIYSKVDLYSLDSNYKVNLHKNYTILQDDLSKISKEGEIELDDKIKVSYSLGYKKKDDKFILQFLKDLSDASENKIKEFCGNNGNDMCPAVVKQEIAQIVNKMYKNDVILNLQKYAAFLRSSVAICGNTRITFIGDEWKEETVTEKEKAEKLSVTIDHKYLLEKETSESSVKLYDQSNNQGKKVLLDLEIKNMSQVFNMYPTYLAYKTKNEDVKVIFYELLEDGIIETFTLPLGETISLKSNPYTLVTHLNSTSESDNLTLNLRQLFRIKSNLPNAVIKKLTVNFDKEYKRITGYDYDPSSVKLIGNAVHYEKSYIIPGDEKSSYGFIEESKNIADDFGVTNKIYDSNGNLIKTVRQERSKDNKKQDSEETEKIDNVLFDISGNLQVAQFYPYDIKDDEASYYGFEDYEVNRIGGVNSTNQNRWFYDESSVVKQEFSFTGENYLRLTNSSLLGSFEPRDQNQTYVASCWVRSTDKTDFLNSTISPYLKASVFTASNRRIGGMFSEVKFKYDDWNYLEVVLDLIYLKLLYSNLLSHAKILEDSKEYPLQVVVSVSPKSNTTLDVDHIRFSPLNSDFQARTYNFKTKEIKEVINGNGLVKRYLYDDYQDQILRMNENGEIEKFNTYTKSSSSERIVNFKSEVQIQSKAGFYENFEPYSFVTRWEVDKDPNWVIAPREIYHKSSQLNQLKLRNLSETFDSYGIRLHYNLQSESSEISFNGILKLHGNDKKAFALFSKQDRSIPPQGELLFLVERHRLMVWIDGGLYFDVGDLAQSPFDIRIYGKVKIRDVIVFIEPSIRVTYFNALNEKVQEIDLESANSVIVTEFLYDELGRQCIKTKATRLQRTASEPILAYYSDFVKNKNPLSVDSVWKLGRIQGGFQELKPHNYYQGTYNDNPLNENAAIGLPGQEFSVSGKFATRFSSSTKNTYINEHYPVDKDYRHHVEHKMGGVEHITVFDKRNNRVATLVQTPGEKDLLATYEYDDDGNLIKTLSPLYHNVAATSHTMDFTLACVSKESNKPQKSLSVANNYDKKGNIVTKTSPDSGRVEYLYNDKGQLKFNIFYSSSNSSLIEDVVYFDYDYLGRLTNTGKLISPPAKEELLNLTLTKNNTEEYQEFHQSDYEIQPTFRRRLKRTITRNEGIPFIEESLLNEDMSFASKRIIVMNENSEEPLIIATNKEYKAGKLTEIEYPATVKGNTFKVTYNYNKLGRLEEIRLSSRDDSFVKYTYNSDGLISTEHHLPDQENFNFIRKYNYNSASFLTQLEDKFLRENIYYTEGSYGDQGYSDGTITRTEFETNWLQYADNDEISLNEQSFASEYIKPEESKLCFDKLKSAGYIDQSNRQAKIYYPLLEVDFPQICTEGITGRQIQNILGKQGFPAKYGHLYNYGAYQELIKAKYFVGRDIPAPLQPDSFAKHIPNIDASMSHDIWRILTNAGYVLQDRVIPDKLLNDDSTFKPHGKQGDSFISSSLVHDLKAISGKYRHYRLPLQKALASYFSKKQNVEALKSNLQKSFSEWSQITKDAKQIQERQKQANAIIEMLEKRKYLENPLERKFKSILKKYESEIPEIVEVLIKHFGKELGEAEFDVEAYEIDENGNHKHFYNGFERYKLEYGYNSNQINTINYQSYASPKRKSEFSIKHDSRGNIIQALHRGIKNITYHSVSNRASSIELVDGKKLVFFYDAQGERVFKRVIDAAGEIKREVSYVRDEFGRSLVERDMTWSSPNSQPNILVTLFIYGPKGLVGFIRRDQYYSVISDHEGSTRLIVKDGKVVAAYDYLPYGSLMRQYGSNSDDHISYRYTGQEWDEETGLYNYHARFYDPSIGRFYQHDPKMQYFSPYKYAGNSPVSVIDRDGEFAFLIILLIIALGAVGGYLGGASVSGTWDPTKWNFKDSRLYLGMLFGATGGALIPVALPLSVEALMAWGLGQAASIAVTAGLGAVGAYAGMARSASEWNPTKWDFSSPQLWNAAVGGFEMFAEAPGIIESGVNFYQSLSTLGKTAFVTSTAITAIGTTVLRTKSMTYDYSKPDFYYDFIENILFAADIPMAVTGGYRFFRKNFGKFVETIRNERVIHVTGRFLKESDRMYSTWRSAFKIASKIGVGIAIPGVTGILVNVLSNNGEFDMSKLSTYQEIINGAMFGANLGGLAHSVYVRRGAMRKQGVSAELFDRATQSANHYLKYLEQHFNQAHDNPGPSRPSNNNPVEIRNTILSVAMMKDGVIFVAYSGLKYMPGYLSVFRINSEAEAHVFLPTNNQIAGRDVALNDNEFLNNKVIEGIKNRNKKYKISNTETYLTQRNNVRSSFEQEFTELINVLPFNNNDFESILDFIGENIKEEGYVTIEKLTKRMEPIVKQRANDARNEFSTMFQRLNKIKGTGARTINADIKVQMEELYNELSVISRKINYDIEPLNIAEGKSLVDTTSELRKRITIVSQERNKKVIDRITNINMQKHWKKFYEENLKRYSDNFVQWSDPTNCAEPHCLSLLSRSPQVFEHSFIEGYSINDIKYLGAFRVKGIKPEPRCFNCEITTDTVKNFVTDPEWQAQIDNELKTKNQYPKNPVFSYQNSTSMPVHNITNNENIRSSRKKRSIIGNCINKSDLHISDDSDIISTNKENNSGYVENGKSTDNREDKIKDFASNLFGWMRTSFNQLFDLKKILPERASIPKMLERIADSNNSLTAPTAVVDVNSTILLLDTLVRRVTGKKYGSVVADNESSLIKSRGYSLDVGLAFEKTLAYAASKSGISMHRFQIHYMDVQDKVIDKIMSGKFDEIAEILISLAEKGCPSREKGSPGKLSPKKFNKFIKEFSRRINAELNDIMHVKKNMKNM